MTSAVSEPRTNLLSRLSRNPVATKELRSRMRGPRAFAVLTVYLLLMSSLIALVYALYASQANQPFGPDSRQAGQAVFVAVLAIQLFLVVFIAPAFTAGSISGEKDRQTYDLLRTTLLPARSLVLGKLVSALAYVMLLVIASIPLQSIAFFLGGIDWLELLVSQLLIVVSAIAFAMVGLYASSIMRSTLTASILTYAGALFLIGGLPFLAMLTLPFGASIFTGVTSPPPWMEIALAYAGLALAATNLPITLVVSEFFLLQEGAVFYFQGSMGGQTVIIPSPWPFYLIFYSLLALLLFWLTVRQVRRVAAR